MMPPDPRNPSPDNISSSAMIPRGGYPSDSLVPAGPNAPFPGAIRPLGAPASPEILTKGYDPIWLLHSFRRRWVLAVGMGVLAAVAVAALVWWAFPPQSRAVALFKVSSVKPTIAFDVKQAGGDAKYETYKSTQAQAVKFPFVLNAALSPEVLGSISQYPTLSKAGDPFVWLRDNLSVTYPGDAEYLQIVLKTENDTECKKILEAVTQAYYEEVVAKDMEFKRRVYGTLRLAYDQIVKEITEVDEKYKRKVTDAYGAQSTEAGIDKSLAFEQLGLIKKIRQDVRDQLMDAQLNQTMLVSASDDPGIVQEAIHAQLQTNAQAVALQEELRMVEWKIAQEQSRAKRRDAPSLVAMYGKQQRLRQMLSQVTQQISHEVTAQMENAPSGRLNQALAGEELKIKFLKYHLEDLEKELDTEIGKVKQLSLDSVELMGMEAELAQLRQVANAMDMKIQEWEIEDNAEHRIQVAQAPTVIPGGTTLTRYVMAGLSGLAGLGMTCFGIAYWDFRSRRLNGPDQMQEGLGIRVVGSLPSLAFRRGANEPDPVLALLTESIDSIRTRLIHASASEQTRVVMVTSSASQEGRSTVASQLAASLARAGRRTLLVDGDLRQPSLHLIFDLPLEDGLCEVLRAEIEVANAVRPTHAEGLWLLAAGRCDVGAIQSLAKDQVQPVFDDLKEEYDFIIVDSAPVLDISDSLIIGQYVDGAVLSVMRDVSQIPKVHRATELLKSVGIRVLGAVVNGVQSPMHDRVVSLHLAGPAAKDAEENS